MGAWVTLVVLLSIFVFSVVETLARPQSEIRRRIEDRIAIRRARKNCPDNAPRT